jgi:hypothetical protein
MARTKAGVGVGAGAAHFDRIDLSAGFRSVLENSAFSGILVLYL